MKTLIALVALSLARPALAYENMKQFALEPAVYAGVAAATYLGVNAVASNDPWKLKSEWTVDDTILEVMAQGLMLMDLMTTLDIKNHPEQHEMNPVLGSHPKNGKVYAWMGSIMVGHAAVAYLLPKPFRGVWQSTFIGMELSAVRNNTICGGLSLRFY